MTDTQVITCVLYRQFGDAFDPIEVGARHFARRASPG